MKKIKNQINHVLQFAPGLKLFIKAIDFALFITAAAMAVQITILIARLCQKL